MPANPPPDYEKYEREQWKANAAEVPHEVKSRSDRLKERIRSFIARFGFAEADVEQKVREDEMFAAHFAKEPRRTGLHEVLAATWIKALPMVEDFHSLPKSGTNAIYVTGDGNIMTLRTGAQRPGKSLDFRWRTKGIVCYAMHKYTKEGGGNQDSQHKEMVAVLKNFMSCNEPGCALFIIVDGPYYQGKKLEELRTHTRDHLPRSYVLSIGDLPAILEAFK